MGDPLIFIRMIHFAATLSLAGAVIFGAAIAGPIMRQMGGAGAALRAPLMRIAWWSFAAALISGVAWLVLLAAEISERAPGEIFSEGILWTVLLHTTFGHDWLARLVLAALLAAALGRISTKHVDLPRWAIAALLASAFAAALVHSGHAAATAGWLGTFHRAADGLHLIAASAWLGGLLPLALLLAAARREEISLALAREATLRFSTLGLISVGALIATGIINGWILAGSVPALIGTDYGRLLLAKIVCGELGGDGAEEIAHGHGNPFFVQDIMSRHPRRDSGCQWGAIFGGGYGWRQESYGGGTRLSLIKHSTDSFRSLRGRSEVRYFSSDLTVSPFGLLARR